MNKLFSICLLLILSSSAFAQKVFIKDGKYGIQDSLGKVITKAKYDEIDDFDLFEISRIKQKDKWGIINIKGKIIVDIEYDKINEIELFSEYIDVSKNNKWGVINREGKLIIEPKYEKPLDINIFSDYTVFSAKDYRGRAVFGAIDNKSLKEIIAPQYAYLQDQNFGYFKASKDFDKKIYGLIDYKNNTIFDFKYNGMYVVSPDIIGIEKNKQWALYNSKGFSISSVYYDAARELSEGRARMKRNNKFGYIDEKGKEIIPCIYDDADEEFSKGKTLVKINGKRFTIDLYGKEITVSNTIKSRDSLKFSNSLEEEIFSQINFKTNVTESKNLKIVDTYLADIFSNGRPNLLIDAIDNIMSEAANNKVAYKEFTNYLYNKYLDFPYVCYNSIIVHLSLKYICAASAPYGGGYWLDEKTIKELEETSKLKREILCDKIAPDFSLKILPQTSTKTVRLSNLVSKYTVLFFWRTDCPKCDEYGKQFADKYPELNKKGVEIVGIVTDPNGLDKAEQYIVANNFNWTNAVDSDRKVINKYNIKTVPQVFLLDKDKKIIMNSISAETLIKYISQH